MTRKTRRKIDAARKAKIALEALREQATVAELAQRHEGPPLVAVPSSNPSAGLAAGKTAQKTMDDLYAKIGQLIVDGSTSSPRRGFLTQTSGR